MNQLSIERAQAITVSDAFNSNKRTKLNLNYGTFKDLFCILERERESVCWGGGERGRRRGSPKPT